MNSIIPFSFENHEVRVLTDNGEPLFVGKDVCLALGYARPNDAMIQHCKGAVKRRPLQTQGGIQEIRVLAEPDVLRLIMKSKLPAAQAFESMVFEEILPTIRKTGSWNTSHAIPRSYPEALMLAAEQAARLEEITPKAVAYDELASMEGLFSLRESAKLCGWPERKFIARLQTEPVRWLYTQGITGRKLPYASVIRSGYMDLKEVTIFHNTTGRELVGQPMITQKGLARLSAILGNFQKAA